MSKFKLIQDGKDSFTVKRIQKLSSGEVYVTAARGLTKQQAESLLSYMEEHYGEEHELS